MLHTVITTIQKPTQCVIKLCDRLKQQALPLVVIGDRKGPASFDLGSLEDSLPVTFLSIERQKQSALGLATVLPEASYSRKNIGYLHAIQHGAQSIYETDDDNAPLAHWAPREEFVQQCRHFASTEARWINVYKCFTSHSIWPRGLPLDEIRKHQLPVCSVAESVRAPIQQGLVNGAADVDAIWRLVMDREFEFDQNSSVHLGPGNWCPFNTQSTWWWPIAFPLLYIPSYCSFRMCDIWKSFVAQRCLWQLGYGIAFHAPEVYQDRNIHDLMVDFTQEIPGYENNRRIAELLEAAHLESGPSRVGHNLYTCYEILVGAGIFPSKELDLVRIWIDDLNQALKSQ